ncbi:MAG TPA: GNAT family N-acetyltransferase [Thermoanaerobaculia bacterium]|nr:GNAT family N-acetyltransferase [Thermoanaerobaculia bacterium]
MPNGEGGSEVGLVTFRPELRGAFKALNMAWLEGNGLLEPADLRTLDFPEASVLAGGGEIFFAMEDDVPVGTCAAVVVDRDTVELAKLAVTPSAQGRGVGRRLCEAVIGLARKRDARRIVLTSNHRLAAAVRLYEALGFVHAPLPETVPYETADVYMVLDLEG